GPRQRHLRTGAGPDRGAGAARHRARRPRQALRRPAPGLHHDAGDADGPRGLPRPGRRPGGPRRRRLRLGGHLHHVRRLLPQHGAGRVV
ncbi:MAG: hypothetical protein AVDCRST_MAG66-4411, partial [uncultured Pseudonocardia sp.]